MSQSSSKRLEGASARALPLKSLCNQTFVALQRELTVGEALRQVRKSAPKGDIFYLYVVDEKQRLAGVVSIRNLLVSEDDVKLSSITSKNIVFLTEGLELKDALKIFSESRFLSLPLVDEDGIILGVLHAHQLLGQSDKSVETLFEERSRGQMFELLGVQAEDNDRRSFRVALGRFPWLLINIFGGALSAFFIDHLGTTLPQAVLYLSFVPILLIISESVGMQTASLTLSLINRTGGQGHAASLFRQLRVATFLGTFSALAIGGGVLLWQRSWVLSTVLAISLFVGTLGVSILGTVIPLAVHRFRIDPRIAAGPIVLALADCCVLLLYLVVAFAFVG